MLSHGVMYAGVFKDEFAYGGIIDISACVTFSPLTSRALASGDANAARANIQDRLRQLRMNICIIRFM